MGQAYATIWTDDPVVVQDCDANGLSVIHLRDSTNPNTDKMEEEPYSLNVNQISCIAAAGFNDDKGKIGGSNLSLRVRHACAQTARYSGGQGDDITCLVVLTVWVHSGRHVVLVPVEGARRDG